MLKKTCSLGGLALVSLAGVYSTSAQSPVITSFSRNGVLVCTNLNPGSGAGVEWAPSVTGPWQSDWASLSAVAVGTNRTINVSVPMYYRVRGLAAGHATPDGMAVVPAGTFTIGDTIDGDLRGIAQPTNVYVSGFYMDTNLVSGGQWQTVMAYATNHGHVLMPGYNGSVAKDTNYPVSNSRWYDVVNWCNARSRQAGLTPVYYADAGLTMVYTNGQTQTTGIFPNWAASGYRLPTEAEYEKAARGGLSGQRFPWGNFISWSNANYHGNATNLTAQTCNTYLSYGFSPFSYHPAFTNGTTLYTSPVGYFPPNGYGLFDMVGNVFVWCWDWYAAAPYPAGSAYLGGSDPRGPASGVNRAGRGAGYQFSAWYARCASRSFGNPDVIYAQQGFRCVRRL
jgi:formylglycine-generating enzyme required for sulfatase activity